MTVLLVLKFLKFHWYFLNVIGIEPFWQGWWRHHCIQCAERGLSIQEQWLFCSIPNNPTDTIVPKMKGWFIQLSWSFIWKIALGPTLNHTKCSVTSVLIMLSAALPLKHGCSYIKAGNSSDDKESSISTNQIWEFHWYWIFPWFHWYFFRFHWYWTFLTSWCALEDTP